MEAARLSKTTSLHVMRQRRACALRHEMQPSDSSTTVTIPPVLLHFQCTAVIHVMTNQGTPCHPGNNFIQAALALPVALLVQITHLHMHVPCSTPE